VYQTLTIYEEEGERRRHERRPVRIVLQIRAAGEAVFGQARNIGMGGICADLNAPLPINEPAEITFRLFTSKNEEPLRVQARVAWVQAGSSPGSHLVGFRFCDPPEEVLREIETFFAPVSVLPEDLLA